MLTGFYLTDREGCGGDRNRIKIKSEFVRIQTALVSICQGVPLAVLGAFKATAHSGFSSIFQDICMWMNEWRRWSRVIAGRSAARSRDDPNKHRRAAAAGRSAVSLLRSGGRPPEELNLFVFQQSTTEKHTEHTHADSTPLSCFQCFGHSRCSARVSGASVTTGESGDWRSMLVKVCLSLALMPHGTLIHFYSSEPRHTDSHEQRGFLRLSAVRGCAVTERCLFLFKAGRPPHTERNVTDCQRHVISLTVQCNCQEKLMSISSHSSLFTSYTHTHTHTLAPPARDTHSTSVLNSSRHSAVCFSLFFFFF